MINAPNLCDFMQSATRCDHKERHSSAYQTAWS